jgi:hypothetical protein
MATSPDINIKQEKTFRNHKTQKEIILHEVNFV